MKHNRASASLWIRARRQEINRLQADINMLDDLLAEHADDPRSNAIFVDTLRNAKASSWSIRRELDNMIKTCERDGIDLTHDPDA